VQSHRALDVVQDEEIGGAEQQAQAESGRTSGDPELGRAGADGERPTVGEAARERGVPHPERDRRVELLPDARHREEERRRHLAQVVRDGVDGLGEVDRGARPERIEDAHGALGDVTERQERELLVALAQLRDVVGVVDLEQDVAMAQHRALRGPGRP